MNGVATVFSDAWTIFNTPFNLYGFTFSFANVFFWSWVACILIILVKILFFD